MKNLILLMTICFGVSGLFAQKIKESKVPAEVKEGFKKNFPESAGQKWEKAGKNFEVEFRLNKVENAALLDAGGNILETQSQMPVNDLPKPAIEYLAKHGVGDKIKVAVKIIDANGTVTYEAETGEVGYVFDSSGSFIKFEVNAD